MDEIVDQLLRDERFCEVMLPRIQKRYVLEQNDVLKGPRKSPLENKMGADGDVVEKIAQEEE